MGAAVSFVVFAFKPINKQTFMPALLTRFDSLTPKERHNPNSPALRRLRKEAAKMLTQGHRYEVICDRLGISRVTLWRWRKNEAFKKMVKELLANLHSEVSFFLAATRLDLCHRMYQLAQDKSPTIAFKAAAFLLKLKV
jgi:transcriptional regulator with XRE-family HTH domain